MLTLFVDPLPIITEKTIRFANAGDPNVPFREAKGELPKELKH